MNDRVAERKYVVVRKRRGVIIPHYEFMHYTYTYNPKLSRPQTGIKRVMWTDMLGCAARLPLMPASKQLSRVLRHGSKNFEYSIRPW